MRIFKNTWFNRFAGKEGITDSELREMVNLLETGQADADLGGGVYKMRMARPGESKAGGYRVIVFFRRADMKYKSDASFRKANQSMETNSLPSLRFK